MAYNQTHFRIRSGDDQTLNADAGWAAAEDTDATIGMGILFRIRIKINEDAGGGSANQDLSLYARHNGTSNWYQAQTKSGADLDSLTPIVLARDSSQFTDGASTTELLTNDGQPFLAGVGDEDNVLTTDISSQETELEFCIFIPRFYEITADTYQEIKVGDTIELRVRLGTKGSGTEFGGTYLTPTITVGQTDYYFGATISETPGQCLWADGNGNLYAVCEPTSTFTPVIMLKSTDGGRDWTEIDSAGSPASTDMEAADGVLDGDTIYMIVQQNDEPTHHTFHTSTHPTTPDLWGVIDEVIEASIAAADQAVSIERRSNGDLVAMYIKDEGGFDKLWGNIKPNAGAWGTPFVIENEASHWVKGVTSVINPNTDLVHLTYRAIEDTVSGELYYRTINSSDVVSGRTEMDVIGNSEGDRMAMAVPMVYWDDGGTEKVMVVYIDYDDLQLFSQLITDGTPAGQANRKRIDDAGVYKGGDSEQVAAAVGLDGQTVHVVFADLEPNLDIYHDESTNDGGWSTDTLLVTTPIGVERFGGSQVFTHSGANGGDKVFGFLYDEEPSGFMGDSFYDELILQEGAGVLVADWSQVIATRPTWD